MSLADWLANRWIVAHTPSPAEVEDLLAVVDRDLAERLTVGIPEKTVDLLDAVRRKRNQATYEHAGTTSAREATEYHMVVRDLRVDVVRWLKQEHPALCPPGLKA